MAKKIKKKYFACPGCGHKHKIAKTKDLQVLYIQCDCGVDSMIMVKNGYHIPSKNGLQRVI